MGSPAYILDTTWIPPLRVRNDKQLTFSATSERRALPRVGQEFSMGKQVFPDTCHRAIKLIKKAVTGCYRSSFSLSFQRRCDYWVLWTLKLITVSAGTVACILPVARARPVPAAAPAPAPIRAPLPPPARPPISAPNPAPPPILVALLVVWPLPLNERELLLTGMPFTDVRRKVSSPGAWMRPLSLAYDITPFTGSPAWATVWLPFTTRSLTNEPDQAWPLRFVPDFSVL